MWRAGLKGVEVFMSYLLERVMTCGRIGSKSLDLISMFFDKSQV